MESKKLVWERALKEPFIKPGAGTVAPDAVTTPDIIEQNGKLDVYSGAVDGGKERLIHLSLSPETMEKNSSITMPSSAKLILDVGPADFDCKHVFDPAVIKWKNQVYLYYSAAGKGEDSIGLAISDDGVSFSKQEQALFIGRSPEVVIKDDLIYLYYVLNYQGNGYSIFVASSKDGVSFTHATNKPVLLPGSAGEWDDMEVTTPRIFKLDDWYYMVFAGLNREDEKDIPTAFGLARSIDLINWEKYPHNPIFRISDQGSWDDGALWFGTPICVGNYVYLLYEGGRLENILGRVPALTQVGLARVSLDDFNEKMNMWI